MLAIERYENRFLALRGGCDQGIRQAGATLPGARKVYGPLLSRD